MVFETKLATIEAKGDNVFCENTKQKKYWNHVSINKDFTQKCFLNTNLQALLLQDIPQHLLLLKLK